MRFLTLIIVACMGLALMQAAAKLAVVLLIVVGLATFAARPQESIGCGVTFLLLGLVGQYPLASLASIGALLAFNAARNHFAGLVGGA